jgi:hypothetical protein
LDGFREFLREAVDFASAPHGIVAGDRHGEAVVANFAFVLGGEEEGGFVVGRAEVRCVEFGDVGGAGGCGWCFQGRGEEALEDLEVVRNRAMTMVTSPRR